MTPQEAARAAYQYADAAPSDLLIGLVAITVMAVFIYATACAAVNSGREDEEEDCCQW